MKTDEILKLIEDKDFLDKIYQFSYHRCSTSYEAEDLCSDIVLAVISAVHTQDNINNFYAYVWTIAHRVYAAYCEKRNKRRKTVSIENEIQVLAAKENEIDELIDNIITEEQIKKIFSEITFLSKAYREVMVMYYIDEYKVKDIAVRLGISETTVKQRLFYARNTIKSEVESMNDRTLSLKPIRLGFIGDGCPTGNDPVVKAERIFSQNLIYLCRKKAKTAKELSEEMCVPMPYIEDELRIQCHGANGSYGTLRKLENGKYITNILLVDYDEYEQADNIYVKYLPELCRALKGMLKQNEEKILSFPYLSRQDNVQLILWSLISRMKWNLTNRIGRVIEEKYFAHVTPAERDFSLVGIAYKDEETMRGFGNFYGCDGIGARMIGGYSSVNVSNIYGRRIDKHFNCSHNLSQDLELLMVIKAIGGLKADELTEDEKEVAAKAIECGYLKKNGNIIEPQIIVIERQNEDEFFRFAYEVNDEMENIIGQIAAELAEFMKKHIPEHLINEYRIYNGSIAGNSLISQLIEECIKEGLLYAPKNRLGAEGVVMIVEK